MNATTAWLQADGAGPAHFCVVNDEKKVAAVCGEIAEVNWTRAFETHTCLKCEKIERSGEPIVFVMPDTGAKITVRERCAPH